MIVAIHQPNFLPWLGFFHKLLKSDVFVLFDDVQLPRGKSYCTRVAIKENNQASWLTVPVTGKSQLLAIRDVQMVRDQPWRRKHLKKLETAYEKAPYFARYFPELRTLYLEDITSLAEFNRRLILMVKNILGARTTVLCSSELNLGHFSGTEYIVALVKALGGDKYLTGEGQGSRRYLEENRFHQAGIEIIFQQFRHPTYTQLGRDFLPNLSVIDLLFNEGPRAREILLG